VTRRPVRIRPEAEAEASRAAAWYESRRPGLGADFMATLDRAIHTIQDSPEASPLWRPGHPYHKHVLRRFPYVVFYKASPVDIEIVAIAHAKRRPGYWVER
jgi:toxin ParE1/3/4